MPKSRRDKPGAERRRFTPDVIHSFNVGDTPSPLFEFLLSVMPQQKRTTVKEFLKYRRVMVNDTVTTQWNHELNPSDVVKVNLTREFQTFHSLRMKIVYEDDDLSVVHKGYGLLSIASDKKKDGTAYSLLRDYVKRKNPANKIFVVHRLDQHTSGLMVFAKTIQAKEALQHNWNNMVLERKYVAVVEGHIEPAEGVVDSWLAENSAHEMYSTGKEGVGQHAVTYYRTIKKRGAYSLVELQLATGRKNQIRVHMSDLGHPIVGDRRYGASTSPIHRLALHAQTLRFIHPVTRRDMNFSTPLPQGFNKLV